MTTTLLMARCPAVLAPAMHTEMAAPATQANVALLRERGITVIDPADGRLTGPDSGLGGSRPADIHQTCLALLQPASGDLVGRRVLITAGGTREPIDPVRFLGNRSSGRQGYALAAAAAAAGRGHRRGGQWLSRCPPGSRSSRSRPQLSWPGP